MAPLLHYHLGAVRPLLIYPLIIALVAGTSAIRALLHDYVPGSGFIFYWPAIAAAGYLGGLVPGIAATLLTLATVGFFDVSLSPHIPSSNITIQMILTGSLGCMFAGLFHRAQSRIRQLDSERAKTATLLSELQHRIANNFQMLGALVTLQANRDHVPKDALTKLGQRIEMLGDLYRALYRSRNSEISVTKFGDLYRELYRSGNSEISVSEFLQRICSNLVSSLGRRGVALDFSGEVLTLDRDAAIDLGMIAVELVENSLKHAFPDGKGIIAVRLVVAGPQDYILEIKDNGTGRLPVQDSSGTGLQIVEALCQQIGAELTQTHDSGLISRVHVREADKGQPRSAASKAKEAGGVRGMTPIPHKQGVKIALAMAMAASVALIAYDPELPPLEPVPPVPKFDKWPPERWLPFSRKMPKPATATPESTKRPLYQTEFMFCWELNHKPYFEGCEADPTVPAIIVSANIRSADTAEALCWSIVDNFTRRASVLHDAGYELRIKSPHTGDKVLAACPM